ncbi:MAG: nitroreductase family protein [Candidatus Heimdallarchaeota archaeon]|nr:nitroreductase family protein [Candidatus Heimdallarchaeota archaeon]MCK4770855.1 nitroreductase family protein [Candidatus Heimdallarchaeota archaeon]
MDIDEAIRTRRSIRKFKDKQVTKGQILDILDAGNRAPSAKNIVQWRFHIFQGEAKKRLVKVCREAIEKIPKIPLMASTRNSYNIMEQAPVVILVLQTCEWGGISPEIQSVSAAIQNMLLKAHSMGLGTVWINDVLFVEPAIMEILNSEKLGTENKTALLESTKKLGIEIGFSGPLIAAIALGYPDEDPKREPRFNIDELTTWYEKIE